MGRATTVAAVGGGRNPVASEAAHVRRHHTKGRNPEVTGLALSPLRYRLYADGDTTLFFGSDISGLRRRLQCGRLSGVADVILRQEAQVSTKANLLSQQ